MKKILLILLAVLSISTFGGTEEYFSDIREKAAQTVPFSDADFTLGEKLLSEIQKLSMTRTPVFDPPRLFTESVRYRSGRLFFTEKLWYDRALAANRTLWESGMGQLKSASFEKSFKIMRSYGFDGCSVISGNVADIYPAAEKENGFQFIPALCPIIKPDKYFDPASVEKLFNSTASARLEGTPLVFSYLGDGLTPNQLKSYLEELKQKHGGRDIAFITELNYFNLRKTGWTHNRLEDLYSVWNRHGTVPASLLLAYFDYITKYLEVSAGVELPPGLNTASLALPVEYYDKVMLPLLGAACAQKEFNGKKLLSLEVWPGYTNYHGSQTCSREGTKTIRNYLALAYKHRVDIILGFEWDELNEDTSIEPTVAKPMALQRIFKYYTDKAKNLAPSPNPDDDLSIPNLIVSQRRQLEGGADFELELLNVPDTSEGSNYSVEVELLDHNGKPVYNAGTFKFKQSELKAETVKIKSGELNDAILLTPKLTIDYKNKKSVFPGGLPFSVMRATVSSDQTWFCTPLRNILRPIKSKTVFAEMDRTPSPGARGVELDAELEFNENLNAVEVLQNSNEIFAWDPKNEYLQNDRDRRLFKLSCACCDKRQFMRIDSVIKLENAQSALTFQTPRDPGNADQSNPTLTAEQIPFANSKFSFKSASHWIGEILFSVSDKEIGNAVLSVKGVRKDGTAKDQPFEWSIPLAELGNYGIKSKVFEDGLMFSLETLHRPSRLPLPLNRKDAAFKTVLTADNPEGVLAVRAVSENGKIWWGNGYAVNRNPSTKKIPASVTRNESGVTTYDISENRVPNIRYEFNPEYGNILRTDAGREFYAHIGGYTSVSTGFMGLIHAGNSVPGCLLQYSKQEGNKRSVPGWEKQPDGAWALRFNGQHGNFIAFPNTVVPQRAGFKMSFEIKPDDVDRNQILFEQFGANYLTGFRLRLKNGRIRIEFRRRTPFVSNSPLASTVEFDTNIELLNGKWQKVVFSFDGKRVSISANNRTASFPCTGQSMWLTLSAFGGEEGQYFRGLLKSFEIIHSIKAKNE